MMNCTRYAEELTAFLDGELSPADSERIRSHLSACAFCSYELRSLREAASLIRSHRRELEANPVTWRLVRDRIAAPRESSRLFHFAAPCRRLLALATAAIVTLIALGTFQYRQVQRRNLEHYINQYIQDRQAPRPYPPVFIGPEIDPPNQNYRSSNPFAEFEYALTDNPFRLEEP